jgi:hypothetical protein
MPDPRRRALQAGASGSPVLPAGRPIFRAPTRVFCRTQQCCPVAAAGAVGAWRALFRNYRVRVCFHQFGLADNSSPDSNKSLAACSDAWPAAVATLNQLPSMPSRDSTV